MAAQNKAKKPSTSSTAKTPAFMKGLARRGFEKLEPDDVGWVGDDGSLDDIVAKEIERELISARSALE